MRAPLILGIVLLGAGAFLFFNGGFSTRKEVLKVGDLKVSANEEHSVAPWIAGAAVIGGLALIVMGAKSAKR